MPRRHAVISLIVIFACGLVHAAENEPTKVAELGELVTELVQTQPTTPLTPGPRPPVRPPPRPSRPQAVATPAPDIGGTSLAAIPRNLEPEMSGDFYVGRVGSVLLRNGRDLTGGGGFSLVHTPGGSRSLKIADNESPRPQDRVYFVFNYFDDTTKALNRRVGADERFFEYRETIGLEKTFCCGDASIGLRLPINTVRTEGNVDPPPTQIGEDFTRGFVGTDTALGDLSVIFKYVLCNDDESGFLLSTGLLVTTPTGETGRNPFHDVVLQPWVGFIHRCGDCFVQGFTAVDVPVDPDDATLLFTDLGVGHFLYQAADPCAVVTAVIPMFEAHVNTPLNHRGALGTRDPAGTAVTVDLTFATSVEFHGRARLTTGLIVPVTGPRPFDFEIIAALNVRF